MSVPMYISSACSISPQDTYGGSFPGKVVSSNNGKLLVTDPDYTRYISPVAIRRMSRALKRGITAGMRCLENAGVTTPHAIIIGTAHGSVSDMETFLKDMVAMNEQALNPTAFIQSTCNSVNGWLAVMTKCMGYNQTYVNRGFALELCLLDAQMALAEARSAMHILAGCFDELTNDYYTIRNKIGYYKQSAINSLDLLTADTPGSIGGEGAHFFTLGNTPTGAACAIHSLKMLQQPAIDELPAAIAGILAERGLGATDIDVLVCGMNGDSRYNPIKDAVIAGACEGAAIVGFKHLCGEYHAASGFGLWLANELFATQQIPKEVLYRNGSNKAIRNVLYCNISFGGSVSLMVLKKNEL